MATKTRPNPCEPGRWRRPWRRAARTRGPRKDQVRAEDGVAHALDGLQGGVLGQLVVTERAEEDVDESAAEHQGDEQREGPSAVVQAAFPADLRA